MYGADIKLGLLASGAENRKIKQLALNVERNDLDLSWKCFKMAWSATQTPF